MLLKNAKYIFMQISLLKDYLLAEQDRSLFLTYERHVTEYFLEEK